MGPGHVEGPGGTPLSIRMARPEDIAEVMAVRGLRREDNTAREWDVACGRMGARIAKGHLYAVVAGDGTMLGAMSVETRRGPGGMVAKGDAKLARGHEGLARTVVEGMARRLFELGCVGYDVTTTFARPADVQALKGLGFTEVDVVGPVRSWRVTPDALPGHEPAAPGMAMA